MSTVIVLDRLLLQDVPAMSLRLALIILYLVTMLSASVRAFGTKAPAFIRSAPRSVPVARGMSTSEPDTTVVDTCQQKIQTALETTDVKVTGE